MIENNPATGTGNAAIFRVTLGILFFAVAIFLAALLARVGKTVELREGREVAQEVASPQAPAANADELPPAVPPAKAASKRPWHPWPPKEIVIGPPSVGAKAPENKEAKDGPTLEEKKPLEEPPKPTLADLKEVASWKAGDPETLKKAQGVLLEPKASSTLKLAAIEKVRTLPPEDAVPLLVRFLEAPAPQGGAYTKPTAVKVLVDFKHALADAALERLANASDDRVRLAILSFKPEGRRP